MKHTQPPMSIMAMPMMAGLLLLSATCPVWAQNFGNESLDFIGTSGNVVLNGTQVKSNVMTGQNVTGFTCNVAGDIMGRHIHLTACDRVGGVMGQVVEAHQSHILQNIMASNGLRLEASTVDGNVTAAGPVQIRNSVISGKLTVTGQDLTLDNARIGTLAIQSQGRQGNQLVLSGGSIQGTSQNSTIQSIISQNNTSQNNMNWNSVSSGHAQVNISPSGHAQINGYRIESSPSQAGGETRVTTPEGILYANGARQSKSGPGTYAAYQREHPDAPDITGPGWTPIPSEKAPKDTSLPKYQAQQLETVVVGDRTVINGDVVFENAPGLLVLEKGAELRGHVINGKLQKGKPQKDRFPPRHKTGA